MKRVWVATFASVASLFLSLFAMAAAPATRPAAIPAALHGPSIPDTFAILLSRSIFARDGVALVRPRPGMGPGGGNGGMPSGPGALDAALALRGVFVADGAFTALMEDPATHKTQNVLEGDLLGGGRVAHISLAGLEYEAGGKLARIAIGQNLKGEAVAPPAPPPGPPPVANGGPPGGPGGMPPRPGMPPGQAMQAGAMIPGAVVAEGGPPPGAPPPPK